MPDIYDAEVERLTANPGDIHDSWCKAKLLFRFATPDGHSGLRRDGKDCGCLTMIRSSMGVAWTDELTAAIRADERIPDMTQRMTPAHLPVFAEWQRRIDEVPRQVHVQRGDRRVGVVRRTQLRIGERRAGRGSQRSGRSCRPAVGGAAFGHGVIARARKEKRRRGTLRRGGRSVWGLRASAHGISGSGPPREGGAIGDATAGLGV